MSDEQKPKIPPLVPGQFPTARASHSLAFHTGGTFVVSFLDERLVSGPDGQITSANFEVARYALGPISALLMANNLLNALKNYVEHFGPLPKGVLPALPAKMGDVIASLEDMLKQSRQDPPAPPTAEGAP
jgi:hypothetical protein